MRASAWNIVYDARGNFTEPHTKTRVPLGTLQVRQYLGLIRQHRVSPPKFDVRENGYPTLGPKNRFGAILFIEKEGFAPAVQGGETRRALRPRDHVHQGHERDGGP